MKLKKILLASAIVASLAGIMATSSFAADTFNAVWNPETNSVDITGCTAPAEGGRKTVLVLETVDGKGSVLDTVAESNIMQIDEQGTAYTSVYVGPDKLTAGNYYEIRIGGDGTLQRMVFQVGSQEKRILGDVNNDKDIDVLDVTPVVNHVLGNSVLSGDDFKAADTNKDTDVDVLDVTPIVNYILGNPSNLGKTVYVD